MLQHQLDFASSAVQMSVVEDLLVAHYPLLAQTAVYDPSIGSRQALSPPQPLSICQGPAEAVRLAS